MICNMPGFRRGVALGAAWWLIAGAGAAAEELVFTPRCDDVWQTCCACGENENCVNWNRDPLMGICPSLPLATDDVTVALDCTVGDGAAAAANTLEHTSGQFTVDGFLTISDTANFSGFSPPIAWLSGGFARSGANAATINANGGVVISGDADKYLGGHAGLLNGAVTLANAKTMTWTGAGALTIGEIPGQGAPARLVNKFGATFDVQTDAAMAQTAFGLGVVLNEGTIIKSAGAGASEWQVELINEGLVHVQSGELRLTGAGAASGEFRVDAGATLTLATVFSFEFLPGISFTGDGGTVLVDTGSNFGALVIEEVELNRLRIANSGAIGPTNEPWGHLVVTDLLEVDGAEVRPPITVREGARLVQDGANESFLGDVFVDGTVDILHGRLSTRDHSFTINTTGVVDIRDDASLKTAGLVAKAIDNFGTVQKSTGAGTGSVVTDFGAPFVNHPGGRVHVAAGTLQLLMPVRGEGGTWQIDAGATLSAPRGYLGSVFELNAGEVRGSGTFAVNTLNNNGGTVSPGASAGVLAIAAHADPAAPGNYTQAAEGVLAIEIGGLTAGTEHDQLVVAGTAALGGTLRLRVIDGFVPDDGDALTVLTASSVTGEFAEVDSSGLPAGQSAEVAYTPTTVVVTIRGAATAGGDDGGADNDGGAASPGCGAIGPVAGVLLPAGLMLSGPRRRGQRKADCR